MAICEADIIAALPPLLQARLGDTVVTSARRLTAGASADTWAVTVETPGQAGAQVRPLILRLDAGAEQFGITPGKLCEAKVQLAALQAGAPSPDVYAMFADHPALGEGYVMQAVAGESLPQKLMRDEKYTAAMAALPHQAAQALARIHATPLSSLEGVPALDADTQLDQLYAMHKDYGEALPVFTLAWRWLKDHIPANSRTTLVHGDYRLGNFLVDEQGLTAVLDWEMTHIGDPMEDIGWLCVNAWRFGRRQLPVAGISERLPFYRAYSDASGIDIQPKDVLFWELFGTFKWGVICQYQAYSYLRGKVPSMERAAIGRRVAETEFDMLACLEEIHAA